MPTNNSANPVKRRIFYAAVLELIMEWNLTFVNRFYRCAVAYLDTLQLGHRLIFTRSHVLLFIFSHRVKQKKAIGQKQRLVTKKIIPVEPTNTKSQFRMGPVGTLGDVFVC